MRIFGKNTRDKRYDRLVEITVREGERVQEEEQAIPEQNLDKGGNERVQERGGAGRSGGAQGRTENNGRKGRRGPKEQEAQRE